MDKAELTVGRSVAQPGSALASGARGREFESPRSDQCLAACCKSPQETGADVQVSRNVAPRAQRAMVGSPGVKAMRMTLPFSGATERGCLHSTQSCQAVPYSLRTDDPTGVIAPIVGLVCGAFRAKRTPLRDRDLTIHRCLEAGMAVDKPTCAVPNCD